MSRSRERFVEEAYRNRRRLKEQARTNPDSPTQEVEDRDDSMVAAQLSFTQSFIEKRAAIHKLRKKRPSKRRRY